MFIAQHMGAIQIKKGNDSLFHVKQGCDTLRDYVDRFSKIMISDLYAFKSELQNHSFHENLNAISIRSITEQIYTSRMRKIKTKKEVIMMT